ncbi:MAG: hypothetical protein IPM91_17300 [Bacteroidetes bacterium]|nr:hypothetical protein [Bacteroidota bacterium]
MGNYMSSIQINDVTLGGFGTIVMLFSSGASSTPYYTLFPASGNSTATLIAGHTYKLFLNTGTAGNNMVTAFIDYDNNINLNAGLEKIGERTIGASTSSFMTFTVPLSAKMVLHGSVYVYPAMDITLPPANLVAQGRQKIIPLP